MKKDTKRQRVLKGKTNAKEPRGDSADAEFGKTKTKLMAIRIDDRLMQQLKAIANDFGSTPSSVARKLMKDGTRRYFNVAA